MVTKIKFWKMSHIYLLFSVCLLLCFKSEYIWRFSTGARSICPSLLHMLLFEGTKNGQSNYTAKFWIIFILNSLVNNLLFEFCIVFFNSLGVRCMPVLFPLVFVICQEPIILFLHIKIVREYWGDIAIDT